MKTYVVSEEHETFDVILGIKELDGNDLKLSIYSFGSATLKQAVQKRYSFVEYRIQRLLRIADEGFICCQGSIS